MKKITSYLVLLAVIIVGILLVYPAISSSTKGDDKNSVSDATKGVSFKQAVGKLAPDFSLEGMDGKTVKLSDYRGKNVVLFFNEGAMCYPACWDQMAAFGEDERFSSDNIVAFSIVINKKSEWEDIIKRVPKLKNAKILFDTSRKVSSAYDVLYLSSSMHKGTYPGHTYVVIDRNGIIRYVLDDTNMAIRNKLLLAEIEKFD